MLLFDVNGQMMTRTDKFEPATDSQEYLKAKFTFKSTDWNGKAKTALFRVGDVSYSALLDSSGICKVPSEALERSDSRYFRNHGVVFHVSLLGEYSTIRITTNEIDVKLKPSGYADAETPADPTESMYQQILSAYADNEAAIQAAEAECEEARSDLVGVKNIFANAIKGNLSGFAVAADDVSPVEHNPIVKVHGKNLLNYAAFSASTANRGTVTFADDGTVTLTATGNDCYTHYETFPEGAKIYVKPGEILTFSWETDAVENAKSGQVYIFKNGTAASFMSVAATAKTMTYTVPGGCEFITFRLGVSLSGDTIKYWNLQIEKGESVTAYTPYIDPSTVTVKRFGKNLLKNTATSQTVEGITRTVNSDGSIIVTGTATAVNGLSVGRLKLPNGKYVISGGYTNLPFPVWGLSVESDSWVQIGTDYGSGYEFDADDSVYSEYLAQYHIAKDSTYNGFRVFPMIRAVGIADANYEKYEEPTTHTPGADGTVSGLTSLSPTVTILTDTDGVVVECEYIRDTNKVIEKIVNAITALGGTV